MSRPPAPTMTGERAVQLCLGFEPMLMRGAVWRGVRRRPYLLPMLVEGMTSPPWPLNQTLGSRLLNGSQCCAESPLHQCSGPLCTRYWIYAAVTAGRQGLLVSNDEMRDHIFQARPTACCNWPCKHLIGRGCRGCMAPLLCHTPERAQCSTAQLRRSACSCWPPSTS